jgi:hypothetical protein
MQTAGVITLLKSVDWMAKTTMKIDLQTAENVRQGKGEINFMDLWSKETFEFKNYFLQDESGQLKYNVITGKILDYKA